MNSRIDKLNPLTRNQEMGLWVVIGAFLTPLKPVFHGTGYSIYVGVCAAILARINYLLQPEPRACEMVAQPQDAPAPKLVTIEHPSIAAAALTAEASPVKQTQPRPNLTS